MWKFLVLSLSFLPIVLCGDVITLTEGTEHELKRYPIALVKYYAPWCGHCKRLAPTYEEAATELKGRVPLLEVNCDEEKNLCSKAGIQGFPTLKVYTDGEFSEDFEGDRSKKSIVDFMLERAAPPYVEIVDATQMKEVLSSDDYNIILQSSVQDEIEVFQKLAKKLRRYAGFYYTKDKLLDSSAETLLNLKRPKYLETKLEESTVKYSGKILEDDMDEWIRKNLIGRVGVRESKLNIFFKNPMLCIYTQVDRERNPSNIRYYRNRLLQATKDLKTDLQFALADTMAYATELQMAGLPIEKDNTLVAIMTDDKSYTMTAKFSVDEVKKFIADFAADKLEPFIKSEPIPDRQEGHVVKVVGRNFHDIVFDDSKDVFIEFFAPWCGHCKALKPKYEELAKKLSEEENVVIAAIDATANTFPKQFEVRGYPTLYWVPKNSKTPIPYEGGREVDDLLKFVAKEATEELSGFSRDGTAKQAEL